jgi:hypothetical protein
VWQCGLGLAALRVMQGAVVCVPLGGMAPSVWVPTLASLQPFQALGGLPPRQIAQPNEACAAYHCLCCAVLCSSVPCLLYCVQVQYAGLAHYEERHEDFLADASVLRRRFTPDGELHCAAALDRAQNGFACAFSFRVLAR